MPHVIRTTPPVPRDLSLVKRVHVLVQIVGTYHTGSIPLKQPGIGESCVKQIMGPLIRIESFCSCSTQGYDAEAEFRVILVRGTWVEPINLIRSNYRIGRICFSLPFGTASQKESLLQIAVIPTWIRRAPGNDPAIEYGPERQKRDLSSSNFHVRC
jgi:hypothetical protein